MDELKDIIVALLVVAPVIIAFFKKSDGQEKRVIARPVFDDEDDGYADDEPAVASKPYEKSGSPEFPFEEAAAGDSDGSERKHVFDREEKKKLVIYSEIMKPKFDD